MRASPGVYDPPEHRPATPCRTSAEAYPRLKSANAVAAAAARRLVKRYVRLAP
jgi:hypothetical protein